MNHFSAFQITPHSVEIHRSKRGPGWRTHKNLTPASHNRLLYIARAYEATIGVYAVHFSGETVTTGHTHYTSYMMDGI